MRNFKRNLCETTTDSPLPSASLCIRGQGEGEGPFFLHVYRSLVEVEQQTGTRIGYLRNKRISWNESAGEQKFLEREIHRIFLFLWISKKKNSLKRYKLETK